jgi:hypothetical protein
MREMVVFGAIDKTDAYGLTTVDGSLAIRALFAFVPPASQRQGTKEHPTCVCKKAKRVVGKLGNRLSQDVASASVASTHACACGFICCGSMNQCKNLLSCSQDR